MASDYPLMSLICSGSLQKENRFKVSVSKRAQAQQKIFTLRKQLIKVPLKGAIKMSACSSEKHRFSVRTLLAGHIDNYTQWKIIMYSLLPEHALAWREHFLWAALFAMQKWTVFAILGFFDRNVARYISRGATCSAGVQPHLVASVPLWRT